MRRLDKVLTVNSTVSVSSSTDGYILTTDQSDARSAGILFLRVTGPPVPVTARVLSTPQRAGSAGIFSQRTNQTQEAQVNSHDGPIGTCPEHFLPNLRAPA
eukprot:823818-Prorocentrum_minimum.AAC.1